MNVAVEDRTDYVPTRLEVRELRHAMVEETDKLREERKLKDELIPEENVVEKDLAVVKD